jgi:uncharacterized membrane protein
LEGFLLDLPITFTQLIWYFAIYSLIGWVWETLYLSLRYKKFIKTGFLKGPFCPLYGTSAILTILLISPFQKNLLLFFIFAILIATFLEYLTSLFFELIFKIKFWDYSDMKLNFQGRIALLVSLFWGFLSVILIKFIHPQISSFVNHLPSPDLFFGGIIFIIYILTDGTYTIISLFGLKKILKEFSKTSIQIQKLSRRHIHFLKSFPNITSKEFDFIKNIYQQILAKK